MNFTNCNKLCAVNFNMRQSLILDKDAPYFGNEHQKVLKETVQHTGMYHVLAWDDNRSQGILRFGKFTVSKPQFFHYTVPAVCAVFLCCQIRKVQDSVVCSEERTSHTAPPPPVDARLRAVGESHLFMMIAEGNESLQLFPPSKNMKYAES